MPTSARRHRLVGLADTSVAVPLVITDHQQHGLVDGQLGHERLGLSGHAAFETYSVITRLPGAARLSPAAAARVLTHNFSGSRFLPEREASELLARLPELGVSGGSVYDALVGATAKHHDLALWTRDSRAREIYRALGVEVRFVA